MKMKFISTRKVLPFALSWKQEFLDLGNEKNQKSKTLIPLERNEVNESHKITGNGSWPIPLAHLVPSPLLTYGELN